MLPGKHNLLVTGKVPSGSFYLPILKFNCDFFVYHKLEMMFFQCLPVSQNGNCSSYTFVLHLFKHKLYKIFLVALLTNIKISILSIQWYLISCFQFIFQLKNTVYQDMSVVLLQSFYEAGETNFTTTTILFYKECIS